MTDSTELNFCQALLKALNQYHPTWHIRHNVRGGEDPPLGVWVDTIKTWVSCERFPQPKSFKIFIANCDFPDEVRRNLMQLYQTASQARTLLTGTSAIDHNKTSETVHAAESTRYMSLPQPTTPFVPREAELEEIQGFLARPVPKLITLIGLPGAGKTRLALACADQLKEAGAFDDIYFIPLLTIKEPQQILDELARQVGFLFTQPDEREEKLLNYLRNKKLLLIFDNFEHLTGNTQLLKKILDETIDVKILVTSQVRLNLKVEQIVNIEGMTPVEGETLFINTATRINPSFTATADEKRTIRDICEMVNGLALGIELAATWADTLVCQDIKKEIKNELLELETVISDVPVRQRSLKAAFEYAWNHLSQEQQTTLQKLCVFRGQFTRQAAQEVSDITLRVLKELVGRSLMRKDDNDCYEILETLRRFGEEKLTSEQKEALQEKHAQFYAALLESVQNQIETTTPVATSATIAHSIDNIQFAWNWMVENKAYGELEKSMTSLAIYYDIQTQHQSGVLAFKKLLSIVEEEPSEKNDVIANGLSYLSKFYILLSNLDEAQKVHTILLKYLSDDNSVRHAHLCYQRGQIHYERAQYPQAKAEWENSVELFRRSSERDQLGTVLTRLGDVTAVLGDYQAAAEYLKEAHQIKAAGKEKRGLGQSFVNLADQNIKIGNYEEAMDNLRSAKDCFEETDELWKGIILITKSRVLSAQSRLDEAMEYCQSSLEIFRKNPSEWLWSQLFALNHLAKIHFLRGEYVESEKVLDEVISQTQHPYHRTISWTYLGHVLSAKSETKDACTAYYKALKLAHEQKLVPLALETIAGIANILLRQKDYGEGIMLLAFVVEHPQTEAESRDRAEETLDEARSKVSPKAFEALAAQGKEEDIDKILKLVSMKGE